MKRQKKSYLKIKYIQVDNMRIFSFYALNMDGWQCLDEFILPPSVISTKHINWTTSVGTWLPSAEHQAGELRVNKMEAQTWSIHVKNYMVTSSFYDDQYKELLFDLCNLLYNICVIMYKKNRYIFAHLF